MNYFGYANCWNIYEYNIRQEHCYIVIIKTTLHIVANPVFHDTTRYIEIDNRFIRDKIQDGLVATKYVASTN
jgi:hypothetical protein